MLEVIAIPLPIVNDEQRAILDEYIQLGTEQIAMHETRIAAIRKDVNKIVAEAVRYDNAKRESEMNSRAAFIRLNSAMEQASNCENENGTACPNCTSNVAEAASELATYYGG